MEVHGGMVMVMRCLIPVTQEMRNPDALRRAEIICDDVHILYVLDSAIFERMERESAYVLDSSTIKATEETIIKAQRKEAEEISEALRRAGKRTHLHFEIGDYSELLESYVIRLRPQILMTDVFERTLLSLNIPIWVDRGNEIKKTLFVVRTVSKIKRIRRDFEIIEEISGRLGCETSILYTGNEKEGIETLKILGKITADERADLYCLQFFDKKYLKGRESVLIFEVGRKRRRV